MMPDKSLTQADKELLLAIARQAIEQGVNGGQVRQLDHSGLSDALLENGASFVTLTIDGRLRGCIGALEAYQCLADDVQEHALAAAFDDYRFPPVTLNEVHQLHLEISRLTPPVPLAYNNPEDLPALLTPHEDGVIIRDGRQRATFLPQVWRQVPDPERFLDQLCMKMGAAPSLWRKKMLEVSIYHVEEWSE